MSTDNLDQLLTQILGGPHRKPGRSAMFAAAAGLAAASARWESELDERQRAARRNFHFRRLIIRRAFGIRSHPVHRVQVRPGHVWTTWGDQ